MNLKYIVDMKYHVLRNTSLQKNVKIPKNNVYSERDECIEYEEFKLCNKYYDVEIKNDVEFE